MKDKTDRLIAGKNNVSYCKSQCVSEPYALNHQIDGKALKQSIPSRDGNILCGTGNDSWYGKN